ncbi:MAG: O-antigen ligase family protein [Armatimonadota bacterium]
MWIDRIRDAILLLTVAVYTSGFTTGALVLLLGVLVVEVLLRSWRWIPTAIDLPLLAVIIAVLASTVVSPWRAQTVTLVAYLLFAVLVSIRPVVAYAIGGGDRVVRLLVVWSAGGVAAAVLALAYSRPAAFARVSPRGVGAWVPGVGTPVIDANTLGTTLAVAAVLGLALLMNGAFRRRWAWGIGLVVIAAGLVATLARAAWVGAAAGVIALMLVGAPPRARLVLAVACAGLIGLVGAALPRWPVLRQEIRSMTDLNANRSRLALWRTAPKIIADHPILGTGYGSFAHVWPHYRPADSIDVNPPFAHNIFLNFAVETGVVGFLAIVSLCAAGVYSTWRWFTRSPPGSPGRAAATAVLAALVTFLVNQLFEGTALTVHAGFGLLALLALGAAGGGRSGSSA